MSETEVIEESYAYDSSIIKQTQSRSDYILVEKCIRRYYYNYSDDEYINGLIDKNYLRLYNINNTDTQEKIEDAKNLIIDILDMYNAQIGEAVTIYFVKGNTTNANNFEIKSFQIAVIVDSHNNTFSVIPENILQEIKLLNVDDKSNIILRDLQEIKSNGKNIVKFEYINDETYVEYIFENYIKRCIINRSLAFNTLEYDYRITKFTNMEEYISFLNNNLEQYKEHYIIKYQQYLSDVNTEDTVTFSDIFAKSYKKTITQEYIQYVCIDNYGKYYIFRETAPMKYTVILDTYTIDLPEFLSRYDNADEQEKTLLNIQKIVDALNDKDYKYVYSKLADSFKQNYFELEADFEKYAGNTFGEEYIVEYGKVTQGSNYNTCKITLKNKEQEITKTIIMQLQEGTNFVFSFNVD